MQVYTSVSEIENGQIDKDMKALLFLLEQVNPCGQKYYKIEETVVVTYVHKLDLFHFNNRLRLRFPIRIVGLPISIERSGVFGKDQLVGQVLKTIKGISLVINSDQALIGGGRTLSSFVLTNRFVDFDEYLDALRSHYRRRIKQALRKGKSLHIKRLDNKAFDSCHYRLYQSVYNRSAHKLEVLPITFFQRYEGEIYEFRNRADELLAFVQIKERGDRLLFMFCGFENEKEKQYDLYFNMLLFILKEGIERGMKQIYFGQTSEETKMKIGCVETNKYLYLHHNNPCLGWVFRKLAPCFSYKGSNAAYRVFKEYL
jgi:hypothetical protein